jgi:ATP-dependent Lon protease
MNTKSLPVLPLLDPKLVVFPGQCCEIDVGRPFSLNAITASQNSFGNRIIIAMQKNAEVSDSLKSDDLYTICTEAEIIQATQLTTDGKQQRCKVYVTGRARSWIREIALSESYYLASAEQIIESEVIFDEALDSQLNMFVDVVKGRYPNVVSKNQKIPTTTLELSALLDDVAAQIKLGSKDKLDLLRQKDPRKRLDKLSTIISEEIINKATKGNKKEVAEEDSIESEVEKFERMAKDAGLPPEAQKIFDQEIKRLKMMPPNNSEAQVIMNYIDTLVSLPWSKSSEDIIDIAHAQKCLDEDHYGLEKVKERIIEFLAVRKLVPDQKGSILCLSGPPGTGKTSICKSIARSMNKEYLRISLGGLHDEAEIRGHRRTYIGAMPGRIIQNLKKVGVNNPLFVLDEIDKLCKDYRGDPASAMLEVLDPEQNSTFQDNYINTPFDLSKVFFITTANDISSIPPALRDRLEIIEIPGYSPFDKLRIAQNYLIPKQKKEKGLENNNVGISEKAIMKIIDEYTCEAGVRSLERNCGTVMRKIAVMVASEKKTPKTVTVNMIRDFLGNPKVHADKALDTPQIGVSTGMAWSQYGGSILFVETMLTPGTGLIKVTGNLGKVLEESAGAAFTWIKANAADLGLDISKIKEKDIHVHLPAGATPKDGPSAGIAITSSLLSALINKPVNNSFAMTGEISLRGRVLPIGGLKEKVLAAHRAGIKSIIFPKDNAYDLEDIPQDVLQDLNMIPVSDLKEALNLLLEIDCLSSEIISITRNNEDVICAKGN